MKKFKILVTCLLIFTLGTPPVSAQNLPYTFQKERESLDLATYGLGVDQMSEDQKLFFESLFTEPIRETADILLLLETLEAKTRKLQSEGVDIEHRVLTANQKTDIVINLPEIGSARFTVLGYGVHARIFTQVHVYRSNTMYNLIDLDIIDLFQWDGAHFSKDKIPYQVTDSEGRPQTEEFIVVQRKDGTQELLTPEAYRMKRRSLGMWKEYYQQKNAQLATRTQQHDSFIPIEHQNQEGTPEGTRAFVQSMIDVAKDNGVQIKQDKHHSRAEYGMNVVNLFHKGSLVAKKEALNMAYENSGVRSFLNYLYSIKENTNADWEHWDSKRSLKTFNTGDYRTTWRSLFFQEMLTIPLAVLLTPEKPWVGPLLTLVWGVTVGFYNKIYRNAQNYARSPAEKNIVVALVSISYNYAFGVLLFGLEALKLSTIEGITTNLFLWLNVWISSWAKVKFQAIPIARERARLTPSELNVFGFKVKWGPSDEAQTASNITSAFKFMDLADKTVLFGPAEMKLTIGKVLFISSGFLAHFVSLMYTRKHDLPEYEALKEEWMRYHRLRRPFLSKDQLSQIHNIEDVFLKYPGTNTKITIPLVGILQDVLESVLLKSYALIRGTPKALIFLSKKSWELVENKYEQHKLRACTNYFGG